ncbi:hypothetical protein [Streptomyces hokutonensis]|uniref:terpene synthase family protein n=1 Tax=Streptomyces hokutonensis TaxID=1306990 RepID=UPI00380B8FDC
MGARRSDLPEFSCPFPVRRNPHAQDAEAFLRAALSRLGADGHAAEHSGNAIGELAALAYPDVPAEHLRVAVLWLAWFWIHDDAWADKVPLGGADELRQVHLRAEQVLRGASAVPSDHLSVRTLALLLEEIRALNPAWDTTAFRREVLRYLRSTLWELDLRLRGDLPSLFAYLQMRPIVAVCTAAREIDFLLCGLQLDPELRKHPLVHLVDAAAANYGCWVNDLCSWGMEQREGITSNLITVARREFGWTHEQAVQWVVKVIQTEVDTFQQLRRDLSSLILPTLPLAEPDRAAEQLEHYLTHYEGWFVANAEWMSRTVRYR